MTRTTRLTELHQDLDRLSREAEDLTETLDAESRLAREEAVGAELLLTRDLIAHMGILWDTLEQLGDLAGRQARHAADDYLATLSRLAERGAKQGGSALGEHLERRMVHLAEGMGEGIEIVSTQTDRACQSLLRLWSPYFSVVRQDWSRRRLEVRG